MRIPERKLFCAVLWGFSFFSCVVLAEEVPTHYIAYSIEELKIGDRAGTNGEGLLGSKAEVLVGSEAIIRGSIIANGNIKLYDRSTIYGNATSGASVIRYSGASVTGTITQQAQVTAYTIPTRTFQAGSQDVFVLNDSSRVISAGSYDTIKVLDRGTLTLNDGTYNAKAFLLGNDVKLKFNFPAGGGIAVNASSGLTIGDRVVMSFLSQNTPTAVSFYSNGTGEVAVGYDGIAYGTFIAPNAKAIIHDRTTYYGAVYAKRVELQPSIFFCADTVFPSLHLCAPAPGSWVNDNTPRMALWYWDDKSGLDLSAFCITVNGTNRTSQFHVSPDTAWWQVPQNMALPEGAVTVISDIEDRAGNHARNIAIFNIDTTKPVLTIVKPITASITNNDTPLVKITYSDSRSGINPSSFNCKLDGTDISNRFTVSGDSSRYQVLRSLPFSEGIHTLLATIADNAGNQKETSISFTIDRTGPLVSITSPPNGTTTNQNPMAVSWKVDGIVQTTQLFETLNEGLNIIRRSATDAVGNVGRDSVRVTLDTHAPVVAITAPVNGLLTNNPNVHIVWTVDGNTFESDTALSEGVNTITRSAADAAGNVGTASVACTLDTHAPEVAISAPENGLLTNNPNAHIVWTIDGNTFEADTLLSEGLNVITRRATDAAGNTGSATASCTLDTHAPVVAISAPVNGLLTNSPNAHIVWTVDNNTFESDTLLSVGLNIIMRRATDAAGNTGGASVSCTLDTHAPDVKITLPANGTLTNKTPIAVAWTVDDVPQTSQLVADLIEGPNSITRSIADAAGNVGTASVACTLDTHAPLVAITTPENGLLTNNSNVQVVWTVDGNIFESDTLLSEGQNTITRRATDAAGNTGSASVSCTLDTHAPVVAISAPENGLLTNNPNVHIVWTVDGNTYESDTVFSEGQNTITRRATDAAGNTGSASVSCTLDTHAPVVEITAPADGFTASQTPISVLWLVDGVPQTTQLSENLISGLNTIIRSSTDAAGNRGADTIRVTYQSCFTWHDTTVTLNGYHEFSCLILDRNTTVHSYGKLKVDSLVVLDKAVLYSDDSLFTRNARIASGGVITHHALTTNVQPVQYKLVIIAQTLTIQAGAKIDVNGKGYPRGMSPSGSYIYGGRGGSNGGMGYNASYGIYGDYRSPDYPGGGGGQTLEGYGTSGGGFVRIVTGKLYLDGPIAANGLTNYYGDGAGGSVWITADQITGVGAISANGGSYKSPGGGGRIAIYANSFSGMNIQTITATGYGAGTIYLESADGYRELRVKGQNSGCVSYTTVTAQIDTGLIIRLGDNGRLQVNGECRVIDTRIVGGGMLLVNGNCLLKAFITENGGGITVNGDCHTDQASFQGFTNFIVSGRTWAPNILFNGGGYAEFGDTLRTGACLFDSNTTVKHTAMSNSTTRKLCILADSIRIARGAKIDVSGRGYPRGLSLLGTSNGVYTGGSHGGVGNVAQLGIYGEYLTPVYPGGGGGKTDAGAAGGGAVRIITERLYLDGPILATGGTDNFGDGAGGSVWITAPLIVGMGSISANGGASYIYGGGGRIAIYTNSFSGINIQNITASGYGAGTIYLESADGYRELRVKGQNSGCTNYTTVSAQVDTGLIIRLSDNGRLQVNGECRIIDTRIVRGGMLLVNGNCLLKALITENGGGITVNGDCHTDQASFQGFTNIIVSGRTWASNILFNGGGYAEFGDTLRTGACLFDSNTTVKHTAMSNSTTRKLCILADSIRIARGAKIDVSGRGYPQGLSFLGTSSNGAYTGGSHGGVGTDAPLGIYGEYRTPVYPGGGGGRTDLGAAGGGAVRIITERLYLDGPILANGSTHYLGDGAGGSVWITAPQIAGVGSVLANGGAYSKYGGGGRIAIYTNSFSGINIQNITASGYGAGTIYLESADGYRELRVKGQNSGCTKYTTVSAQVDTGLIIRLGDYGMLEINGDCRTKDVRTLNGGGLKVNGDCRSGELDILGYMTLKVAGKTWAPRVVFNGGGSAEFGDTLWTGICVFDSNTTVTQGGMTNTAIRRLCILADTVRIARGAKIDVSGRGYPGAFSPFGSYWSNWDRIGGCHGGRGKNSSWATFGDYRLPEYPGGGGGGTTSGGGSGGGVVRIVASRLYFDGSIITNGAAHEYGDGAGGSVLITVPQMTGAGSIEANGGTYGLAPGAGGRIAIYTNTFSGMNIQKFSATGWGAGTIYLESSDGYRELRVKGQSSSCVSYTPVPAQVDAGLIIRLGDYGRLEISGDCRVIDVRSINGGMLKVNGNCDLNGFYVSNGGGLTVTGDCRPGQMDISGYMTLTVGGKTWAPRVVFNGGGSAEFGDTLWTGICVFDSNTTVTQGGMTNTAIRRLCILADTVRIARGAKIDVSGRGYPGANSPFGVYWSNYDPIGGCHGGRGAQSSWGTFGDYRQPEYPGGGGGFSYYGGGSGGGVVRIVAVRLYLDGSIISNGAANTYGDGAGGSVWITVPQMTGAGSIEANGGSYRMPGGGGRIAVFTNTFSGMNIQNFSATGWGAGTIYLEASDGYHELRVKGQSSSCVSYTFVPELADTGLFIRLANNGRLQINGDCRAGDVTSEGCGGFSVGGDCRIKSAKLSGYSYFLVSGRTWAPLISFNGGGYAEFSDTVRAGTCLFDSNTTVTHASMTGTTIRKVWIIADSVRLCRGSKIDVNGRGYPQGISLIGTSGNSSRGGSHGGMGCNATMGTYGDFCQPQHPGAGGGIYYAGGQGGGMVRLDAQRLYFEGSIEANGTTHSNGDGAGGSVWITAPFMAGAGTISANGGNYNYPGGGGRIAVYTNDFSGINTQKLTAIGSASGTVLLEGSNGYHELRLTGPSGNCANYTVVSAIASPELTVTVGTSVKFKVTGDCRAGSIISQDHGSIILSGKSWLSRVALSGGSTLELGDTMQAGICVFDSSSTVTHTASTAALVRKLCILSDSLLLAQGANINADGKGFPGGYTINGGAASTVQASSGSHGGKGGGASCPIYGNYLFPETPGSGGGSPSSPYGPGGGVIRLSAHKMHLLGSISANGIIANTTYPYGGAGGSIWISADTILGAGSLAACGGGGDNGSQRGGGGRIAVYSPAMENAFVENLHAEGWHPGTIYLDRGMFAHRLIVDNKAFVAAGSPPAHNILIADDSVLSVRIAKGATIRLVKDTRVKECIVTGGSSLGLNNQLTLDSLYADSGFIYHDPSTAAEPEYLFIAGRSLAMTANAKIDVTGKGYPGGYTIHGQGASNQAQAGGSYGGKGYGSSCVTYGLEQTPFYPGSGGGSPSTPGSSGGGIVRISAKRLILSGKIIANGDTSVSNGSGSGGSIWINADTIIGSGSIEARAKNVTPAKDYTGGGGRVALYGCSIDPIIESTINTHGYQDGSIYVKYCSEPDTNASFVEIMSPHDGTITNSSTVRVVWAINGKMQDSLTNEFLHFGVNPIVRSSINPVNGKSGSDTVLVTVDITPPNVKIASPVNGSIVTSAVVAVKWYIDGGLQLVETTQSLNPGLNQIVRSSTDIMGNTGSDTVWVTYDSYAPDLLPISFDATLHFDPQQLTAAGVASGAIVNAGNANARGGYHVGVWEDIDLDGAIGSMDHLLGESWIESDHSINDTIHFSIPVQGTVKFAGNRLYLLVDDRNEIAESDEINNIRSNLYECEPKDDFEPELSCLWGGNGPSTHVLGVPNITHLTDDNHDGVIDSNDIPTIVFITFSRTCPPLGDCVYYDFTLHAIKGDGSGAIFSVSAPGISFLTSIATGDIDGDGVAEIICVGSNVTVYDRTGAVKWVSRDVIAKDETSNDWMYNYISSWYKGPTLADINHDGRCEIIVGKTVLSNTGATLWRGTGSAGRDYSIAADINMDGDLEIIAGGTVYRGDGSILWRDTTLPDAYSAVGNFDADTFPEIVFVQNGNVYLADHNGKMKWGPVSLPDYNAKRFYAANYGGAPVIADFDNDGKPDIGVSSFGYTVLNGDGTLKWQYATGDRYADMNGITSAGVFDFDGDGIPEVVQSLEDSIRVFRGNDGKIIYRDDPITQSWMDLPIVADIDNDRHAEVVLTADELNSGGIYILKSADSTWMNTRKTWNEYSYHLTNIDEKGQVPRNERPSWLTYNTYRQNLQTFRSGCVDLTASRLVVRESASHDTLLLSARIGNGGSVVTSDSVIASFYLGDPQNGGTLLGTAGIPKGLRPGAYRDIYLTSTAVPSPGSHAFCISADDDGSGNGRFNEKDETNNKVMRNLFVGNSSPVITSSPATLVSEGQAYSYRILAQDPDGDSLIFEMSVGPPGMHVDASTGGVEWTPGPRDAGAYAIVLAVRDIKGGFATQEFNLTVHEALNAPPVISSFPIEYATEGVVYFYRVVGFDFDRDPLVYRLLKAPQGMVIDSGTGDITWVPSPDQAGIDTICATVSDGVAEPVAQTYILRVQEGVNDPPRITSIPLSATPAGNIYRYQVLTSDAEGDTVRFSLTRHPAGMTIDSSTGLVLWNPARTDTGNFQVAIRAYDIAGAASLQEFTLRITPFVNKPPVIISSPIATAIEHQPYSYQIGASDPDGDAVTYILVQGPSGMVMSQDGMLRWTPGSNDPGAYTIKAGATDGPDSALQSFSLNVINVNDPPVISSVPETLAVIGVSYAYHMVASDPDRGPISFQLLTAPAGMTIAADGTITWSEDGSRPVLSQVVAQARDDSGSTVTQTWNVRTVADRMPPTVELSVAPNPALPGEDVTITVNAGDNAGVASRSLSIDGVAAALDDNHSCVYHTLGEDTIALLAQAVDINGNTGLASSKLVVSNSADNTAPSVSISYSPAEPKVGDIVTFTVNASDDKALDQERVWLNVDGRYVPLHDNTCQWKALMRGTFQAVATAYDRAGNFSEAAEQVAVSMAGSDGQAPSVHIVSPEMDSTVTGTVEITGTATDGNFAYYTLCYRSLESPGYIEFYRGETPVNAGVLGVFDGTVLENGQYVVRLTGYDKYGNSAYHEVQVSVLGLLKIGNFSLSFSDMKIPMAGLDVEAVRSYDSRVKAIGDFGFGWSLDLRSIKLQESCPPGAYWNLTQSYRTVCFSGICYQVPTYNFSPLRKHSISVAVPNGPPQVFDVVPHLFSGDNPYDIGNPGYGYFSYDPRPGTYSKLTALDAGNFVIMGGVMYDEDGFFQDPYNPQQYKLTLSDSSNYIFNQDQGGLVQVGDLNGNTISISNGAISRSAGSNIQINRDAQGRVSSISDGTGRTISYAYDGHGNLQKVVDANGNMTRFKYGPNHYLTEIIDPRGVRAARTEYDDAGRIVRQINPAGDTLSMNHDLDDSLEATRDFNGNEAEYTYDSRGNVLTKTVKCTPGRPYFGSCPATWRYTYDSLNNLLSTINPDGTSRGSTWERGNEITSTNERHFTTTRTYNGKGQVLTETNALNRTTRYEYDAAGNLLRTIGPDNRVTGEKTYGANGNVLTETDGEGHVTGFGYDSQGRMTSKTDALGRVTRYVLDSRGQTVAEVNAKGDTTKFAFDANGNQTMTINVLGDTVRSEYNCFNKIARQTDALGLSTRYEYDVFGQLRKTVAPDSIFTQKAYDGQGNVKTSTDEAGRETGFEYDQENRVVKTTFNDDSFTRVEYDKQGRRSASIDANGNRTEYEYDAAGNNTLVRDALGHETIYRYDGLNRRFEMEDALAHKTTYTYDDYDRLVRTTFHDGTFKTVEYDSAGRKTAEVDQEGMRTVFTYDSVGNLRTVRDAMGYVTRYAYDESNNRISQTDANNHTTTMEYDKLNRLILRTYPNGDHEHFTYDANGNQTAKVDGVGDSTVFTYDNRNREIGRRFTNSGHTVLTKYTIDGKPDTIVDYRGMTTYKYDIRGRQASVTNPDGAFIRGYYDAQGNRISQKTPLDSVAYAYDSLNRMVAVSGQNSGTTNYFYDAVGNRDSVHSGNGTSAGYHYDNLNRLVNVTNHNASGPMSSYTYALNNAGIRTGVTELDGSHVAYGYDDCYKLTSEVRTGANPYTISYGYDNVGNRLSQTKDGQATTYMYNNRDQLTSETGPTGTTTNIYDHAGRLKSKTDASGTTTYGWIDNDRMASVTGPGISVTYGYDQNGLKVSETTAGNTKQYLVDYQLPYGQVVAETDDAGNPLASYIYGLDRISQTRTNNSLLTTHYYLTDGQGSVRQLTDLNGNVTDGWTFDAFGNIVNRTGTTPNMFLYVGEQWDANAGFYYNRARWYNPAQGRFTSVDPWSGDPQCPASLHRYLYCGADPINLIDPSGEYWNVQSALAGISLWMRIIATRIFPWILKGSPLIPTLPFLQKLANAPVTGPTVQVVTKLTQFPQAGRQLSCAIGENAEALANAARTTGTIFRANIPQQLFDALTKIQWAQTYYTSMGEVVGTEVVFSARAMALIIKFFQ